VPAFGLVAEMDTGFEQFLHCDVSHGFLLFGWFFPPPFSALLPTFAIRESTGKKVQRRVKWCPSANSGPSGGNGPG
ncbi:MAG: hypothetical protein WBM78_19670, partial [Desulfobacterales bacterium]